MTITQTSQRPVPSTLDPDVADLAGAGARWGTAAALAWMAFGIESIVRPHVANYRDVIWFAPWFLTYMTFLCLHRAQRSRTGQRGDRIFAVLTAGMVLAMIGNVGVVFDIGPLKTVGFPFGALTWVVVMVFFGLSTMRAGLLRKRAGIAMIALEPGSMLVAVALSSIAPLANRGAYSGCTEKGAVIALLAFELHRLAQRRTAS